MISIVCDYTFYKIVIGTSLIGITTGILGCFALLNKQSLLGDTIAHATLPGLTGMFLLTMHQSYLLLLLGAGLSGLAAALCVHAIVKITTLKMDAALGVILSTFFGIGIIFLTIIQKRPHAHQAGLDKFLFGQAATLLHHEIFVLAIITCIVIVTVISLYKELTIIIFDPSYAQSIGISVTKINIILLLLIVLTIIIGLQTVGLILISSFLIAPALAARQWTSCLTTTIFLSIGFSLLATMTGTYISCSSSHIPTGPVIVIIATIITLVSMILSPQGYLGNRYAQLSNTYKKIISFLQKKSSC